MRMGDDGPDRGDVPQLDGRGASWRGSSTSTATSGRRAVWPGRSCAAAGASRSPSATIWSTPSAPSLGPRAGPADFARLFQAVRIAVNDELAGLAARAAGVPRRARGRGPPGGDHLSFGRGPAGEAGVPGVGQRPASARPSSRSAPAAGRPLGRLVPRKPIVPEPDGSGGEPTRAERAPPDLPGGRCILRGGTG